MVRMCELFLGLNSTASKFLDTMTHEFSVQKILPQGNLLRGRWLSFFAAEVIVVNKNRILLIYQLDWRV